MKDLFLIACGAGLRDGYNPCMFMTCAVFIALAGWFKKKSLRAGWFAFIFALSYMAGTLAFNFGFGQIYVLKKDFILVAQVLYFALGVWAFVWGVVLFRQWFLFYRKAPAVDVPVTFPRPSWPMLGLMCLMAAVLSVGLSAMATLWPMDKYVLILGNVAIMKNRWQSVMPLVVSYILISMWLFWLLLSFISIKKLRPSLLKIVCSAVFFTASSCMVMLFR